MALATGRTSQYQNLMRSKASYQTGKRERMLIKMEAMRAAKARKRLEGEAPEYGPRKLPAGELLGVLQWHAADGCVHRIPVRQGARANQIRIPGCRKDHGFDWLLSGLRRKIAQPRRRHSIPPDSCPELCRQGLDKRTKRAWSSGL